MLGKLMKYELKANSKLLIPLYLVVLVLSIVHRIVATPSMSANNFRLIDQFITVTYTISTVIVLVVTTLYMIVRFYKNLLTDEGYLMFTLPVSSHHLIISKLIVTLIWAVVSVVAVLLSLFVAFGSIESIPHIIGGIKEALGEINRELGGGTVIILAELTILGILSLVSSILLIYLSIAMGQLFSKHKIVGAFVSYMGIYTALQFVGMLGVVPLGVLLSDNLIGPSIIPNLIFPIAIVILAVGCVGFYLGTNYILKRKLNLE